MTATLSNPRQSTRSRIGVTLLFMSNGAAWGGWASSVALVKEHLQASDAALGAALLCVAAGAILAMPIVGWLGSRGTPRLLTAATLALAAAMPLPALVDGVPGLALTLLFMGAAAGSMDVSMNARASRIEQERGTALMSSFHAAFSLGGIVGTAATGAALALGTGALGGLATISALLLAAALIHLALDPAPDLAAAGGPRLSWPTRAVAGLGILCGLAFLCEGAVADWSSVFLREVAAYAPSAAGLGFGAFSTAMVIARLLGDRVVRRFRPAPVLTAGALLAAAGVVLATLWPGAAPVGFFCVGLGAGNAAPIFFSTAGRSGPTALAAVATLGYGGMLAGPPIIGALAEFAGLRLALQILTVAALAIALSARRALR